MLDLNDADVKLVLRALDQAQQRAKPGDWIKQGVASSFVPDPSRFEAILSGLRARGLLERSSPDLVRVTTSGHAHGTSLAGGSLTATTNRTVRVAEEGGPRGPLHVAFTCPACGESAKGVIPGSATAATASCQKCGRTVTLSESGS